MDAAHPAASSAPSPKRRAPLAALDVNAVASSLRAAVTAPALKRHSPGPPRDDGEADASPAAKKPCLGRDRDQRQRSPSRSPDCSSVFDTSVADASYATMATTTTEPDPLDGPAPPARRLTREQAREKVEILRLRLGLASYKLRTGQTAVPLADLQPRPLPSRRTVRVQSPPAPLQDSLSSSSSSSSSSSMAQQHQEQEQACSSHPQQQHRNSLDDGATVSGSDQDRGAAGDQHRALDSGALVTGGAASGLLSLARGCEMR